MFGPDSNGGKDAHRLTRDDKRRRRNAESLAVTVAGEIADVEKLQDDLKSVYGILSTTNTVGPLNAKKNSNTASAAFGEFIEVLIELTHGPSNGGYLARLKHIAKEELKNMRKLRDNWDTIERNNDVNLVRRSVAGSFQNISSVLDAEEKSLNKQEKDVKDLLSG